MEYIKLNNGVQMPLAGMGMWDSRGEECEKAVEDAIACGYRLIDTAIMYKNEREVGNAIQNAMKHTGVSRKELFITSKLYNHCNSYEKAKAAIEESLETMQLDYMDLFLVHEPYEASLEMYRALCDAYEKGLVRAIGISNFNRRRLDLFLKECGIVPAVNQIESHVFYPQLELVNYMKEKGITAQAWGPLAQGQNNIFTHPVLTEIGSHHKKTASQIALRYLAQNNISVVPKTVKVKRMKENLDIFDFELTNDEMRQISTLNGNKTLSPWTENWK